MDKEKKGETHRGYYWVYQNSFSKIVLFDYWDGRSREGPEDILQGFQSYLQTDGYTGYGAFAEQQGVTLIHCMAHACRKFHDALSNDEQRPHALKEIQKLCAIERICKDEQLDLAVIEEVHQRDAISVLKELGLWLQQ